jgi:S-adenosylmethionine decarboxylase
VTVAVLLAESHATIHTWPAERVAFVDVFTCGDVDPCRIVADIVAHLGGTATLGPD